jgi:hypothetical protein
MKLPDGKIYSCPERCSIPRWDFLLTPSFLNQLALSAVIKTMRLIPAIHGSAHRHVNFASGFVTNHTFMGSLRERITCVG